MGAKKIFTYFISLFSLGVIIMTVTLIIFSDAPQKTPSIKEYERYINTVENNTSLTICTRTSGGMYGAACIESITINNKDNLITYINHKYNTDVLRDIDNFNKKLEEYRNSKNNNRSY